MEVVDESFEIKTDNTENQVDEEEERQKRGCGTRNKDDTDRPRVNPSDGASSSSRVVEKEINQFNRFSSSTSSSASLLNR